MSEQSDQQPEQADQPQQPEQPEQPVGASTPGAAESLQEAGGGGSFAGTPTFGVDDGDRLAEEVQSGGSPTAVDQRPEEQG